MSHNSGSADGQNALEVALAMHIFLLTTMEKVLGPLKEALEGI